MAERINHNWTRWKALIIYLAIDFALIVSSFLIAYVLRLGVFFPQQYREFLVFFTFPIMVFKLIIFYLFGLYHGVRRYASVTTLHKLIQAVTVSSIGVVLILYFIQGLQLPRSVFVIDWLLCIILLGGVRFYHRSIQEVRLLASMPQSAKQVIIAGAGDGGELLVREMLKNQSLGYLPIGFIDDDPAKQRMRIHGVKVVGTTKDLSKTLGSEKVDEVIIAMPSASREVKRQIVSECEKQGIKCRTVPALYEIIDGNVSITQIRDVDVEDVLGREPVKMKLDEISAYLSGKCVLVTGAGGSIGSELCRQIALVRPSRIVLVDHSENDLFKIDRRMRTIDTSFDIEPIIEDITNIRGIDGIIRRYQPEVIFHAAAYKHVPMLEANPESALATNFIGTKIVAQAALENNVKKFILISTDKAVEPKSIMGISKALAELEMQAMAGTNTTSFISVRFGNVLGSSGSVVPILKEQISKGGPVTVTHPEMRRYFMTIPEAVQLVIQAGAMGKGGEIYVLDMGEQVKIRDLAENIIRLSGLEPEGDIPIEYMGIRPGEKLEEKLFGPNEKKSATNHEKIFLAQKNALNKSSLIKALSEVEKLVKDGDIEKALKFANEIV